MKRDLELLNQLRDISKRLTDLANNPQRSDLDPDAVLDLNLARESVEKLIERIDRIREKDSPDRSK